MNPGMNNNPANAEGGGNAAGFYFDPNAAAAHWGLSDMASFHHFARELYERASEQATGERQVELLVGFSHPVQIEAPAGIDTVEGSGAAAEPDRMVSASSKPGSRKCARRSKKPGTATSPLASITSVP